MVRYEGFKFQRMSAVVFLNALALWVVHVNLNISMPYILLTVAVL
jgi:hypothetical protein